MSPEEREMFRRLLAQNPLVWIPTIPAGPEQDEVPGYYRERTDAELDVLVRYAVRAVAACERESKRFAAANPRPLPPSMPRPPTGPSTMPPPPTGIEAVLKRLFR